MYRLMKTVTELIAILRNEGFIYDFTLREGKLCCDIPGNLYSPDELIIERTERYEGDSNPSDNAIIYAITAKDGTRGILLDSYGAYSDPELSKVIAKIPVREVHGMQDKQI